MSILDFYFIVYVSISPNSQYRPSSTSALISPHQRINTHFPLPNNPPHNATIRIMILALPFPSWHKSTNGSTVGNSGRITEAVGC